MRGWRRGRYKVRKMGVGGLPVVASLQQLARVGVNVSSTVRLCLSETAGTGLAAPLHDPKPRLPHLAVLPGDLHTQLLALSPCAWQA